MAFSKCLWLFVVSLNVLSFVNTNEIRKLESEVLEVVESKFQRLETQLMSKLHETVQREFNHRIQPLKTEVSYIVNEVTKLRHDIYEVAHEGVLVENRLIEVEKAISVPFQACESSPCANGARCVDINIDVFICLCRDGFFGVTCSNTYADSTFLATIVDTLSPIPDPIVFDETRLNPGGNYDNTTGIYTAPIDGVYQFNINIRSSGDTDFRFYIVVDGVNATQTRNSDVGGSGSLSATASLPLQLRTGQEVWVRPNDIGEIFGSRNDTENTMYSWFSAYLISAD